MYSILTYVPVIVAQADAATAGSASPANSVFELIKSGGWIMIPIGLLSMVALTVIIERLIALRRSSVIPKSFLPGLKPHLSNLYNKRRDAIAWCNASNSPIGEIFAACIKRLGEPVDLLEKHIQEAGEREVFKLRKRLRILSVVAAVAPLLGLLGTIFGMITAFQTVADSSDALGRPELLATGIYEAMVTTAAGLCVAIPSLIAYHWISAKVEHLVFEMDQMTLAFLEEHTVTATAPAQPAGPKLTVYAQASDGDEDETADSAMAAK